jgi:hypothetical protein
MTLAAGARLGLSEILAAIGAGECRIESRFAASFPLEATLGEFS